MDMEGCQKKIWFQADCTMFIISYCRELLDWDKINNVVESGKGKFGTAFVELSLRITLTIFGEYSHDEMSKLILKVFPNEKDRERIATSLQQLIVYIDLNGEIDNNKDVEVVA